MPLNQITSKYSRITMNGAPDWQDGECCFRCRLQFTLVARKHHCRNCGNIFCAKCSSQQIPLPKLNIEKPVRVCDGCYEKISSKNEDPLALAINKTSDTEQTTKPAKTNSKPGPASSSKSTTSNKPAANASAPSEQELKEEEELQLALALSLSEAPVKISFPDCKQFEEPISTAAPTNSNHVDTRQQNQNSAVTTNVLPQQSTTQPSSLPPEQTHYGSSPDKQQQFISIQPQMPVDYQIQSKDQELFRFVNEVQSVSEVFTNRVNSNKLRNRPVADDSAIQALFLKLTNMHTKLLEFIKIHDEERAGYESIQDKLSQISDARAALDALREEHQEKIRQEAAEAERKRQSQLALKLEMMRQKKSQMMQFQREMALQRIQQQEMMLRQPQGYQAPPTTSSSLSQQVPLPQTQQPGPPTSLQQQLPQPPPIQHQQQLPPPDIHQQSSIQQLNQSTVQQQQQQQSIQQPPMVQLSQLFGPTVSQANQQFLPQLNQQHQSTTMVPKLDDEAPLISFDD